MNSVKRNKKYGTKTIYRKGISDNVSLSKLLQNKFFNGMNLKIAGLQFATENKFLNPDLIRGRNNLRTSKISIFKERNRRIKLFLPYNLLFTKSCKELFNVEVQKPVFI